MSRKAITAFTVTAALSAAVISGCGNSQSAGGGTAASSGPFKITMMNDFYTTEPPQKASDGLQALEQYTNTQLDITWIPFPAYQDKEMATLASGSLPMVFFVADPKNGEVINGERNGQFWDLTPYLKNYPNLSKIDANIIQNLSVDGKVYAMPKMRILTRNGVVIRKDWLDNLGLQEPHTLNDLIKVATAFTTQDPDKNGKNDTYGFAIKGPAPSGFPMVEVWEGGANNYAIQNGQVVPDFLTPQYMDTLKLYKSWYDQKIINPDFATVSDSTTLINQGKAGIYLSTMDDINSRFTALTQGNPNAKLDVIGDISGVSGIKTIASSGFNGEFLFPKSSVKTEADLKQILTYFDKLLDPKMLSLFNFGIEGKQYQMQNGKAAITDMNSYTNDINNQISQLRIDDGSYALNGQLPDMQRKVLQAQMDNQKNAVNDPAYSLISQTYTDKGKSLTQMMDDARVQFIMGKLDEAGFNQKIQQWRQGGGDQIIKEMTDQYNLAHKK